MSDPFAVRQWLVHKLAAVDAPMTTVPDWAVPALRQQLTTWPENDATFVLEVRSEAGVSGFFGPCSRTTVQIVIDQIAPSLLGIAASAYRAICSARPLGRHTSGAHFQVACSAARLAVLDLWSRQASQPVVGLLGGPMRPHVNVYATALGIDTYHPLAADVAKWLTQQRFYGQKWALRPTADGGIERQRRQLNSIREAAGPDAYIMIDGLRDWPADHLVRIIPLLADVGITWIEEPCRRVPRQLESLVRQHGVPLAMGEHEYDPLGQLRAIAQHEVDVWQPDVGWHGGLLETLRIADMARLHGIRVFPHGGNLPATLALAGLTDPESLPAVEFHLTQEPGRQACLTHPILPESGLLPIRQAPGLVDGFLLEKGTATDLTSREP